ncbi:hypothetical protein STEG23_024920, partial [Scotinomys teguina]
TLNIHIYLSYVTCLQTLLVYEAPDGTKVCGNLWNENICKSHIVCSSKNHPELTVIGGQAVSPWDTGYIQSQMSTPSVDREKKVDSGNSDPTRTQLELLHLEILPLRPKGPRSTQTAVDKDDSRAPRPHWTKRPTLGPLSKAKMGRHQCKSAYNVIQNKTTRESSPPPKQRSDHCHADKAEENDLKNSLMKMLEETFEEKMKNVSKEIGENTNKKLEEINKEIEEKKSKKLEEMNNEIEEKKNKKLEEMNNEIEEKKNKRLKEIEEKRNKKLQELGKEMEEKINKKLKEMNKEIEEKTNKKLEEINKVIEEKTNKKLEKNQ